MSVSGRRFVLVLTVFATVAFFTGCKDWEGPGLNLKPPTDTTPTGPNRSTKVGLLEYFARALEDRDIDGYAECLHPDYQFWFADDDRTDPDWDWTDWIGRAEDIEITARMFDDEDVTCISIDLVNQSAINVDDPEDRFYTTQVIDPGGGEFSVTVYWGDFLVNLHVIEQSADVCVDHWVDGRAYIYLLPDPLYQGQWQIWKIEDKGDNHRKTEKDSWSSIKALFRK